MSGYIDESALMKLLELQAQSLDLVSKALDLVSEVHGLLRQPGDEGRVGAGEPDEHFQCALVTVGRLDELAKAAWIRGLAEQGFVEGHDGPSCSSVVGASEGTGAADTPSSAASVSEDDVVGLYQHAIWLDADTDGVSGVINIQASSQHLIDRYLALTMPPGERIAPPLGGVS